MRNRRLIALDGCRNFRDVGGYATTDGGHVRMQHLYRSGVLAYLSEGDRKTLSELKISTICDLRDAAEREGERTNWASPDIKWVIADSNHMQPDAGIFRSDNLAEIRDVIENYYRKLPEMLAPLVATVFNELAHSERPMLVHCAMGKDRTGFVVGLILTLLGASKRDILADYTLSDDAYAPEMLGSDERTRWHGVSTNTLPLREAPREIARLFLMSAPEYLDAALTEIETVYGTVENYLLKRSNVARAALDRIRMKMITDPPVQSI